jgi:hypothetical protein
MLTDTVKAELLQTLKANKIEDTEEGSYCLPEIYLSAEFSPFQN